MTTSSWRDLQRKYETPLDATRDLVAWHMVQDGQTATQAVDSIREDLDRILAE